MNEIVVENWPVHPINAGFESQVRLPFHSMLSEASIQKLQLVFLMPVPTRATDVADRTIGVHVYNTVRDNYITTFFFTTFILGSGFTLLNWKTEQESCAIAKMTARCALYK